MSERLPPVDPGIRDQLARRSAGRPPEGLVGDISAALDASPMEQPRRLRLGAPASWGGPRVAAAACLALIVVMGTALVAVPRLAPAPASQTETSALTTPQLAALLAEAPLAVNTTLVASVTVDSRNDVCPMNRYPALGVIEGMDSQVCVMGYDTTTFLSSDRVAAAKVTGTFAFRYLAPGYLGLLGELTPPSAGVAFSVADEWPLGGKTFLVDGWLGADATTASCALAPTSGDVLLPDGEDCPYDDWLGTSANWDNPRPVEAGGMRIIDSIDPSTPMHGVFVVRSVTGGCPGDPVTSSRGCPAWRVLAKVADISLHAPAVTSPPATPSGAYPTERALTTDELARVLAGPPALNTALVASVTIDPKPDACVMTSRPTYGVVHGLEPPVCVVGPIGSTGAVAAGQNNFAFRYMAPGILGLLGLITPASASTLAHRVDDDWAQAGKVFLVEGWLGADPYACPTYVPITGEDLLNPDAADQCEQNWMSDDDPNAWPSADATNLPMPKRLVLAGGMRLIDGLTGASAVHGVYVVRAGSGTPVVLAKVADITIPRSTASLPSRAPSLSPSSAPPQTPVVPSPSPSVSSVPVVAPTGVVGPGNTALSVDELETRMVTDPNHLAGRIAIVQAPIPTQISCQSDAGGGGCAVNTKSIAAEGAWAVRVGTDGTLSVVGQIATPSGSLISAVGDMNVAPTTPIDEWVIVDGWLDWGAGYECDATPRPTFAYCDTPGSGPYLVGQPGVTAFREIVQAGAFQMFGSENLEAGPVHGLYLVHFRASSPSDEILARLEVAAP